MKHKTSWKLVNLVSQLMYNTLYYTLTNFITFEQAQKKESLQDNLYLYKGISHRPHKKYQYTFGLEIIF